MRIILNPIRLLLQVLLLAAMLLTSFMVLKGFFNDLVTSKQYGLEIIVLFAAALLVLTVPFQKLISITVTDILVALFACWYLFNHFVSVSSYSPLNQLLFNVLLWGVIYLFVRQLSGNNYFVWGVAIVWMVVVLMQSGLGLMQLYGLERSYHGLFSITGTFHNPGPFSGFVVSGLPLALLVVCYTEWHRGATERHGGIYLKWLNITLYYDLIAKYAILTLAWITLISVLLVLPPAQSRAAWITGVVGCLYVIIKYPGILPFRDNLFNRIKRISFSLRIMFVALFLLVASASVAGLYIMKQGSANGRLLMWQVTTQIIQQKPLAGHGTGAFNGLYMNEQANWFASGKGTEAQAMVAGSPDAPFNEPLKLWIEKGLIGLLLAGGILYFIFFHHKSNENFIPRSFSKGGKLQTSNIFILRSLGEGGKPSTFFAGALISVLVFSLFSYPFDISTFILQLIILVALLADASRTVLSITGRKVLFLTIPLVFAIILGPVHFIPQRQAHYQAMKTWQEADQLYNYRAYSASAEAYEEAFPALQTNGLFLQMYGKALSMNGQHEKSNEILAMAQKRFSSQIIQNTLGDNHKALGNYPEAEAAYTKSGQMIPSLLLPKYLLAKLYEESGQHHKAKKTAEEILNSPVKVESSATREIMNEMRSVISEQ